MFNAFSWSRSLDMAKALCEFQYKVERGVVKKNGRAQKRKRTAEACLGNFPSPEEISWLSASELNTYCNLGYRASFIVHLAGDIVSGKLKLQTYEMMNDSNNVTQMMASLEKIDGVSKFGSANIMMCLGYYQFIPCDTETIRHLKEVGICVCVFYINNALYIFLN